MMAGRMIEILKIILPNGSFSPGVIPQTSTSENEVRLQPSDKIWSTDSKQPRSAELLQQVPLAPQILHPQTS